MYRFFRAFAAFVFLSIISANVYFKMNQAFNLEQPHFISQK